MRSLAPSPLPSLLSLPLPPLPTVALDGAVIAIIRRIWNREVEIGEGVRGKTVLPQVGMLLDQWILFHGRGPDGVL